MHFNVMDESLAFLEDLAARVALIGRSLLMNSLDMPSQALLSGIYLVADLTSAIIRRQRQQSFYFRIFMLKQMTQHMAPCLEPELAMWTIQMLHSYKGKSKISDIPQLPSE